MGHFGAMSDLRDLSGGTSGAAGIYAEDLNRSIPPLPHLSHGPSPTSHFSSAPTSTPNIHPSISTSQTPTGMDERLNESEKIAQKRDKDAIYS